MNFCLYIHIVCYTVGSGEYMFVHTYIVCYTVGNDEYMFVDIYIYSMLYSGQ